MREHPLPPKGATLQDAARANRKVRVYCHTCGHDPQVDPFDLAIKAKKNLPLHTLVDGFRCRVCSRTCVSILLGGNTERPR